MEAGSQKEGRKLFVVTDIHSHYEELIRALSTAGYNSEDPNHVFLSLGDLLDRGPDPIKCLRYVNAIPASRKILIRGNHEDLLQDCFARETFYQHDLQNGTADTVLALAGAGAYELYERDPRAFFVAARENPEIKKYLAGLRDYYEYGDYVFVHGWLPARRGAPEKNWRLGDWREARWFNGMEKWKQGAREEGKTIYCGHVRTSWGHTVLEKKGTHYGENADFSPFVQPGIVALDACTAYSHEMHCVVLDY